MAENRFLMTHPIDVCILKSFIGCFRSVPSTQLGQRDESMTTSHDLAPVKYPDAFQIKRPSSFLSTSRPCCLRSLHLTQSMSGMTGIGTLFRLMVHIFSAGHRKKQLVLMSDCRSDVRLVVLQSQLELHHQIFLQQICSDPI